MKTVPATDLRRNFFETLKRLAYEKDPILIERRGKAIAALVPPDFAASPPARTPADATRLLLDPRQLDAFCARHGIKTLYLFGSALTDGFTAGSDVDLMFEAENESPDYFEQMRMTDELERMFGRPVDLVSRKAVAAGGNRFRRRAILEGARVIFAR